MLTRDDFLGGWALRRQITDHLTGQDSHLSGEAQFTNAGTQALAYHESGTLVLSNGAQIAATRDYLWAFTSDRVDVQFADGKPFHSFIPAGHAAGSDHPCGADFYTVRYDFTKWPRWTAVWTVTGPRKDYVSTSEYAPLGRR